MLVDSYLKNLKEVISNLDIEEINNALKLIKSTIRNNKKIITCGNGGSANTASHYITDWNKSYNLASGKQCKGICLCDNLGLLTAYANDISYEAIFSEQLKNIGEEKDLLIVVSGSGNSKNVIEAIKTAKNLNITSLSFVGYNGGKCKEISDYTLHIPSFDMQLCEDIHLILGHIVMKNICKKDL